MFLKSHARNVRNVDPRGETKIVTQSIKIDFFIARVCKQVPASNQMISIKSKRFDCVSNWTARQAGEVIISRAI